MFSLAACEPIIETQRHRFEQRFQCFMTFMKELKLPHTISDTIGNGEISWPRGVVPQSRLNNIYNSVLYL